MPQHLSPRRSANIDADQGHGFVLARKIFEGFGATHQLSSTQGVIRPLPMMARLPNSRISADHVGILALPGSFTFFAAGAFAGNCSTVAC